MEKPILIKDLGMMYHKQTSTRKYRFGVYMCFCGKEFSTMIRSVKSGNTLSCGCYSISLKETHGLKKHRLYDTWNNMMARCTNKSHKYFDYYGGKGISVCNRWINIENFIDDMYPTYKEGLTIDRINNDGNYEPSNCRWATKFVQARNTKKISSNNTSGYRGVSFKKDNNKFRAQITLNSKKINLGYFKAAIDAAYAYDKYVIDNKLEHTINFKE